MPSTPAARSQSVTIRGSVQKVHTSQDNNPDQTAASWDEKQQERLLGKKGPETAIISRADLQDPRKESDCGERPTVPTYQTIMKSHC